MQDDFFVEVHDHADPPLHPHNNDPVVIRIKKELTEAEKLMEK